MDGKVSNLYQRDSDEFNLGFALKLLGETIHISPGNISLQVGGTQKKHRKNETEIYNNITFYLR
jgi:hypothetical protein